MKRRPSPARTTATISGVVTLGTLTTVLAMDRPHQSIDETNPRSPVHRPLRQPAGLGGPDGSGGPGGGPSTPPGPGGQGPRFPLDLRSIDGLGNNPMQPDWGAAGVELLRVAPAGYDDGAGAPAGADRPSPRLISNLVMAQTASMPNTADASDFLWQWGQFLDHDIDETPIHDPAEEFDIEVPAGDPWFDPTGTGTVTIPLDRSAYEMIDGVRQQFNNITAYIDASNVYGADEERALELRTLDGTGRLKTSAGDLLPFNVNGFDNAPTAFDPSYFLAGDIRANEQVGLTAMHTLFMREHNFHADQIRQQEPQLSGDEVYEHARAIVMGEMQAITYREFLPLLLGPGALPPYQGPRPDVNAGISNVFATAAYRVGHTMLSSTILRVDSAGEAIDAGHLSLADGFFSPDEITAHSIAPILRGLASQRAQQIDAKIIDEVRNFLFGPPGAGGFDLASLNIQRGRDHGLPSYNQVRVEFGLPAVTSFDDINTGGTVASDLAAAYATVDDIDAWVGMLAEAHVAGAMVGETLRSVLSDQFARLRDGDRYWYRSYLPNHMVQMIEQQTLGRIIRRNTSAGMEVADDVFRVSAAACPSDLDGSGLVDFGDLLGVLAAWGACGGCAEDLDGNGFVEFADVLAVIGSWGSCP